MKKLLIGIILTGVALNAFSPVSVYSQRRLKEINVILREYQQQKELQQRKDGVFELIVYIESRGNPNAYAPSENAAGILQIRPVMMNYINRDILKRNVFTLQDRWDPIKSREMWEIVMDHLNPEYDPAKACYIWNGGTTRYNKSLAPYMAKFEEAKIELGWNM